MGINYKKLRLPDNPLRDDFDISTTKSDPGYQWQAYTDYRTMLNDETIDIFKTIGILPTVLLVFYDSFYYRKRNGATIHKDLTLFNNRWEFVPCAINYEINPIIDNATYWYDTSNSECIRLDYSEYNTSYPLNHLNGISYSQELSKMSEKLVQQKPGNYAPILFRTDVGHNVEYITRQSNRYCLSLRFDINEIPNWDTAVSRFSTLML